ncbi:ankyrin repeat domain-containing protein [Wolbachia endosymbiont of Tribolium confusum]|uniref:ankyrin repeat domain-containing protein n=1 Tax=Wolbachia endosymbiont of Tribolium confusum TaxID=214474 RepID=UPI001CF580EA|nr:ankyrin repeat domain-containing protein [Wolbachia endosymbiont of Tribolium confusum]MCA7010718.1 ankyrin repeat domain-containing protein [Wolbachia endosymbiont of Tribolium confusum]
MIGNLTYEDVKKFVTDNPNIAAQEFGEKLKQSGPTDAKICDLFMDILRSGKSSILNDYDTFLKIVELLAKSNIKIDIGDTTSKTVLDYAVSGEKPNVIKIFLDSDKFDQERKSNALLTAVNEGKVQEFEIFLDYIDHTKILEVLNTAPHNESTEVMKILLNNKRFTGEEKVQALSHASIDGELTKVRLLLKYMKGVPEDGIRNLLEIIEEKKLSLRKELQIDSEFKVDFSNSDHNKYLSSCVIIALLRSAINKKQNTPDGAESNVSNTSTGLTLNNDDIRNLCLDIDRVTKQDSTVTSFEDLQKRLKRKGINLQSKCEKNAVLEYAIKDQNLNVIKFLLQNGMTIINAIGQEGRYYVSKIEEDKSILCSVVHYTDNSNAEILGTLLRNINAEQSKLNPEDELYRLYQQLKDDAFCTAFAEKNSVAATALIQNDREIIVPHGSATNKEQETFHIETNSVSNSNRNVISRPVATAPPVSTNGNNNKNEAPVSTRTGPTVTPNNDKKANGFVEAQFSPPHEKETKYKKSKESFYASLRSDVVGVVIAGLFVAAAVTVPSLAGALVCSVLAILVVMVTGLHVKNFTLPSYSEMRENKVEPVNSSLRNHAI